MDNGIHFIAGLPRSGSTLLAAILRQNPRIHAGMSSPVGPVFQTVMQGMGPQSEMSVFVTPEQRRAVLLGLFDSYYKDIHPTKVVFDTGRLWCSRMPAIAELFPNARVIVCVRQLAWVIDSFEKILRQTPLMNSKMFRRRDGATVYTRVAALTAPHGPVGFAWNAAQEAFYGEHADRLVVIDYEALTRDPKRAIDFIYEKLDLPPFEHDFTNVTYEGGGAFDSQIGVPGLHTVTGAVRFAERSTILPLDLFERFTGRNFWRRPGANPRNVAVLLPQVERRRRPARGMRMAGADAGPPVVGA